MAELSKKSDIGYELTTSLAISVDDGALYHGREAYLEVAEVAKILHRPARKTINKIRIDVAGEPLPMRLILTRIVDEAGEVLAEWYLLSNVPVEWADAAKLARWLP